MPAGLQADSIGPVDVAVIAFDGNQFNGDVAPALAELHDSGTVRVIDVAFVRKEADGTTSFVEVGDADVAAAFERVNNTQFDLLSDEDLTDIAESLEPSSSAMVIVWENSWLARFATAVRESKGSVLSLERIPRESVLRAVAALDED
jgi:uncharacterized membrane protein